MIETLPCRSCGAAIIAYPDDPYVATLTGDPTFPYFTLCPPGENCFFDGNGNSTRSGSLLYDCCGHTLTGWYQVGDNLAAVSAALIVQCQNSYASECVPSTPAFTPILPVSTPLYFNNPHQGPPDVTTIPSARFFGTTQTNANTGSHTPGLVSLSDLASGSKCLNTALSITITASGTDVTTSGNTWTLDDSNLPPGLTSNNTGGITLTISGSPSAEGTYPFMVTFIAHSGSSVTKNCSITVWDCTAITLSDLSPSESYVGDTNTWSIVASEPIIASSGNIWSLSELPPGLTSSNTGGNTLMITGTPTTAGTFYFTVSFVMPSGNHIEKYYTLVVDPEIVLSDLAPANGYVGETHTWYIVASGPTIPSSGNTWDIDDVELPPGLSSYNTDGDTLTIDGTLTTAGTFPFDVMFTMADGETVAKGYSLVIDLAVVLSDLSPVEGYVGETHTWTITASGPTIPSSGNTWTVGTLPPGLTSSNSGGATLTITGTFTTAGNFPFDITFTMSDGETVTKGYSLLVDPPLVLSDLSSVDGIYGFVGEDTTWTITASGPTIPSSGNTWTVGTLPPGITSSNTGGNTLTIHGTPTTAGTFTFDVTFTMATSETVTKNYTLILEVSWVWSSLAASYSSTILTVPIDGTIPPGNWALSAGVLTPGDSWRSTSNNEIEVYGVPAPIGTYYFDFIGTKTGGGTVHVLCTNHIVL